MSFLLLLSTYLFDLNESNDIQLKRDQLPIGCKVYGMIRVFIVQRGKIPHLAGPAGLEKPIDSYLISDFLLYS